MGEREKSVRERERDCVRERMCEWVRERVRVREGGERECVCERERDLGIGLVA